MRAKTDGYRKFNDVFVDLATCPSFLELFRFDHFFVKGLYKAKITC